MLLFVCVFTASRGVHAILFFGFWRGLRRGREERRDATMGGREGGEGGKREIEREREREREWRPQVPAQGGAPARASAGLSRLGRRRRRGAPASAVRTTGRETASCAQPCEPGRRRGLGVEMPGETVAGRGRRAGAEADGAGWVLARAAAAAAIFRAVLQRRAVGAAAPGRVRGHTPRAPHCVLPAPRGESRALPRSPLGSVYRASDESSGLSLSLSHLRAACARAWKRPAPCQISPRFVRSPTSRFPRLAALSSSRPRRLGPRPQGDQLVRGGCCPLCQHSVT